MSGWDNQDAGRLQVISERHGDDVQSNLSGNRKKLGADGKNSLEVPKDHDSDYSDEGPTQRQLSGQRKKNASQLT